ncbi:MAG: cytochrome c peroxidase [Thermonemataceae bacterium]|nr:cytochrome c peroxidase [Thermonemataceae bacterium]
MKKLYFLPAALLSTLLFSCGGSENNTVQQEQTVVQEKKKDAIREKALLMFAVLPDKAENPKNPLSEAKITLGKTLYFDTRLSKDGKNSCNSCHNLSTFGVDNLPTSPGDLGKNGTRNSPTVFNAALHSVQFWDGRAKDVEEQAGGPILNHIEMNMPSEAALVARLKGVKGYEDLFKAAFPDSKEPISFQNITLAIAAFERKLLSPSKFDKYLAGEDVYSELERKGLETFMNAGCMACHKGALIGGDMYQKFQHNGKDKGRFEVTKNENDMYMFKVPSLRNAEKTYPYFHDGSVAKLEEAVKIMGKSQLNKDLSDTEISEIVTFLNTLTGEIPEEYKKAPTMPQ